MATDPITAGMGAVSALGNVMGNAGAAREAGRAASTQRSLTQRMIDLYDTMMGVYKQGDQQGAFNPDALIAEAERNSQNDQARAMRGAAAAMRVAGYAPGDTTLNETMGAIGAEGQIARERNRLGMRMEAPLRRLQALSMINPSTLNAPLQAATDQLNYARSQQQPIGSVLGSVLPYMTSMGTGNPKAVIKKGGYGYMGVPVAGGNLPLSWLRGLGQPIGVPA